MVGAAVRPAEWSALLRGTQEPCWSQRVQMAGDRPFWSLSGLDVSFVLVTGRVTYFFKEPCVHLYQTETWTFVPKLISYSFDQIGGVAKALVCGG